MFAAIRAHWITSVAVLAAVFLIIVGLVVGLGAGEGERDERIAFLVISESAGLSIVVGLWGLRRTEVKPWIAYSMVAVGILLFAAAYWWLMFLPLVMAAAVLYAGVAKRGLERELRPVAPAD